MRIIPSALKSSPSTGPTSNDTETSEKLEPAPLDSVGMFKISLDRSKGVLAAIYYDSVQMDYPVYIVKGETAERVFVKIVEMGLLSKLDPPKISRIFTNSFALICTKDIFFI